MADNPVTNVFPHGNKLLTASLDELQAAQSRYGTIKTYFKKYRNPVGIELEIENVSSSVREIINSSTIYWRYHDEGSLKYSGAEFVSHPLYGHNIDYAIHEFALFTKKHPFTYSVRTSIHVHVNVSFLTIQQAKLLITLSALFEPLLYQLCSEERRNNPYCYPITHLNHTDAFSFNADLKYGGINPATIARQYSLEYRQMHGHNDWRLLRRWVQLLCKLYYYVRTKDKEAVITAIENACKGSAQNLAKEVFGASLILFDPEIDTALEYTKPWALAALCYVPLSTVNHDLGEW